MPSYKHTVTGSGNDTHCRRQLIIYYDSIQITTLYIKDLGLNIYMVNINAVSQSLTSKQEFVNNIYFAISKTKHMFRALTVLLSIQNTCLY